MIRPAMELQVYLCREPVDMRKAMDGLALLVQEAIELDPFSAAACSGQVTADTRYAALGRASLCSTTHSDSVAATRSHDALTHGSGSRLACACYRWSTNAPT